MGRADQLRRRQGGAIAIMVGLAVFVLVGMIGLVVDLGRLYIAKTELQNAADACALSAARELTDLMGSNALARVTNAGIVAGGGCPAGLVPCPATEFRNKIGFQGTPVNVQPEEITFSTLLDGPFTRTDPISPDTYYVRCAPEETNPTSFVMWFMGVMGIGSGSVRAEAIARLSPSQAACAIPLGMCTQQAVKGSPLPNWGFVEGVWYDGRFNAGGGGTGSYNWIDFTPPGGGASELAALLAGEGQCEVPTSTLVGQTGVAQSLANAWNTRFGLYKGSYDPAVNRMDWTGFTYTALSWPAKSAAYAPSFSNQRDAHSPYQGNAATGLTLTGFRTSDTAAHARGADRRVVAAPVVRCQDWLAAQTIPIRDWACVLMLSPIDGPDDVSLEFLGMAGAVGSPCATLGAPGGSIGPNVPTLVR